MKALRDKVKEYTILTDSKEIEKYELAAIDTFLYWSRITWCKFAFVYTNNELNRKVGRVGAASGVRTGSRNLDVIVDKPSMRNPSTRTIRYYDVTRKYASVHGGISKGNLNGRVASNKVQKGQWRSFAYGTVAIVSHIWSFERNKWVTDFADFNIKSQPTG
jgi:hypothetical protein